MKRQLVDVDNFADVLFGSESPLLHGNRRYRRGQHKLARGLQRAMRLAIDRGASEDTEENLFAALLEGETGVGKTLVYVTGALVWAISGYGRVLISVSSNRLLDQVKDEIARVRAEISLMDRRYADAMISFIKGRDHYLCLRKTNQTRDDAWEKTLQGELSQEDQKLLKTFLTWFYTTGTFDMDCAPLTLPDHLRPFVAVGAAECKKERSGYRLRVINPDYQAFLERGESEEIDSKPPKKTLLRRIIACPHYENQGDAVENQCGLYRAKRLALVADVVVTNSALLAMDAESSEKLGAFTLKITDEAHLVAETVRSQKSKAFTIEPFLRARRKLVDVVESYERELQGSSDQDIDEALRTTALLEADRLRDVAESFFESIGAHAVANPTQKSSKKKGESVEVLFGDNTVYSGESFARVREKTNELFQQARIVRYLWRTFEPAGSLELEQFDADAEALSSVFLSSSENVTWLTRENVVSYVGREKRLRKETVRSAIHQSPANLSDHVWNALKAPLTVAFSATMSVDGSFDYMRKTLGFPEESGAMSVPSPFNFKSRMLCFAPKSMPNPSKDQEEHQKQAREYAQNIAEISRGHSLVLFTSREDLFKNRDIFSDKKRFPFRTLMQGIDSPGEIEEVFRSDLSSSLLATRSYGTGFDVPGDALQCVHCWRLPFSPPSAVDLWQQLCFGEGDLESGRSRFYQDVAFPRMTMEIKQWIGRGIRRESDHAVIAVYDPRFYQSGAFRSLPEGVEITDSLDRVAEFFSRFRSER